MKYWVGTTDNSWFRFLSGMQPDEVNFWQPRGGATSGLNQSGFLSLKGGAAASFAVGTMTPERQTELRFGERWKLDRKPAAWRRSHQGTVSQYSSNPGLVKVDFVSL